MTTRSSISVKAPRRADPREFVMGGVPNRRRG
jgi:hypothetical protein